MSASLEPLVWDARAARDWIAFPRATDDKYSRGVLTVIAGSSVYPGAAVLSVEAAARTGVGMIRYCGPAEPTRLVLERRPEVVVVEGKSQAYLAGSGIDPGSVDENQSHALSQALASGAPLVLDAGMLGRASEAVGPCVITPHARELARLLSSHRGVTAHEVTGGAIARDPAEWAQTAADELGVTVLLKGAITHVVSPADERGTRFHAVVPVATHWLATAGTGDVLAGILGALVATHAATIEQDSDALAALAATAAFLHSAAGAEASRGGPLVALDVAEAIPRVIAQLPL